MYIKLNNVHGLENSSAYYRKLGDCFDFVYHKDYATNFTEEEANKIMKHADSYCEQYGAKEMIIER